MGKSKATSLPNSLTDLLDVTKQTTNFINLVTSIAKDIEAIKERNYTLLNLELDKIKGKSVKEVVGSIVGVATSMMDRIKTDYDIFDIGNEIARYQATLTQYRDLIPNKALLANVENALDQFRDSLKAVYRTSRAGEAYKLIVSANDLLGHIDILAYSLTQVAKTKKARVPREEADTNNRSKSKRGRKKKLKEVGSIQPDAVDASTSEIDSAPVIAKPKRGRPKKITPLVIPALMEETSDAIVLPEAKEEIAEAIVSLETTDHPIESVEVTPEVVKAKRGRPKKIKVASEEEVVEAIVIPETINPPIEETIATVTPETTDTNEEVTEANEEVIATQAVETTPATDVEATPVTSIEAIPVTDVETTTEATPVTDVEATSEAAPDTNIETTTDSETEADTNEVAEVKAEATDTNIEATDNVEVVAVTPAVVKAKRGRPKSTPSVISTPTEETVAAIVTSDVKAKRGRPKASQVSAIETEGDTSSTGEEEKTNILKTPVQWKGKGNKDTRSTKSLKATKSPKATKTKEKATKAKEKLIKTKEKAAKPNKKAAKAKEVKNISPEPPRKVKLVKAKKNWSDLQSDTSNTVVSKEEPDTNDND